MSGLKEAKLKSKNSNCARQVEKLINKKTANNKNEMNFLRKKIKCESGEEWYKLFFIKVSF